MSNLPVRDEPTDVVRRLLPELRAQTSLEQVARHALRSALELTSRALQASPFADKGRISRAILHLRTTAGYRRLFVEGNAVDDVARHGESALFSATAFRWVTEYSQSVEIDVTLARVFVGSRREKVDAHELLGEFASNESRARLLERSATHLFAVPLRDAAGQTEGMLSLEAECVAATGVPFVWGDCASELTVLCDLVTPFLVSVPAAEGREVAGDEFLPVVGKAMAPLVEMLAVFAEQAEPILICGPTGSGKSRLARWCHERSPLKDKPFEVLDLSSVPEELQLAELFGWRRGAFTGAVRDNPGVLARAKGGTLFIDEIGNLSLRAQMGLLHVFEERTYRVLGDDGGERQADVRFILGTNEDLRKAVLARRFREDLYYRVNVLPVVLPSLRERADEISRWALYLANRGKGGVPVALAPEAERLLVRESWPGNLRQLDNIMRRAAALASIGRDRQAIQPLLLREEHVRRALAYEAPASEEGPTDVLVAAAAVVVKQALALDAAGQRLDLDQLDGFKGLVLGAALERLDGDRDAVFRLFGREKLVSARNHYKVLRRELARARQLHEVVSPERGFPFDELVERDGEPGSET